MYVTKSWLRMSREVVKVYKKENKKKHNYKGLTEDNILS